MIERTLVILKADAVQRGLMGRILQRFEDVGLKVVGAKMVWVDKAFAEKHYWDVEERYEKIKGEGYGKKVLNRLTDYLAEGPVMAFCIEGAQAVKIARKLVGTTYPNESAPGTIRGDFAHASQYHADNVNPKGELKNLIHASGKPEEAQKEIALWFAEKELHSYNTVHDVHVL
ncbi:MAG: nucleoside-diphosphate kinase [Candidatus Diapherotrites archaeon]